MLYPHADIFPLSQLINLKYLSLDDVNLDKREELLYIVSVLKSASNLVEFDIAVNNTNTLCFLAKLACFFYCMC